MHSRRSATPRFLFFISCLVGACTLAVAAHASDTASDATRTLRRPASADFPVIRKAKSAVQKAPELPPLPPGVEQLDFREFFHVPVGPRGLELTDRMKSLDGKRVRILGYMVLEDLSRCNSCVPPPRTKGGRPIPAWLEGTVTGHMLLTPLPCTISRSHYGLADDLPPQTLHVIVPTKFGQLVSYVPGPMLLTGILSIGDHREPDGRISLVRLTLDPPPDLPATSPSTQASNQPTKP